MFELVEALDFGPIACEVLDIQIGARRIGVSLKALVSRVSALGPVAEVNP